MVKWTTNPSGQARITVRRCTPIAATFATLVALIIASPARANVTLPAIFSDHMVLQADRELPIWGWADPGEDVTISVGDQTKATKADAQGKWHVKLGKLKSGEATTFTAKGKNTITVNDVLVGEVWLCSGQSNMGMTVQGAKDFPKEKAAADFPQIRMFKEGSGAAPTPQEKGRGGWFVCSPATVGGFSATAYFFGRDVYQKLHVPVGLINSSVGGTPIEAWTSTSAMKAHPELQVFFDSWNKRSAAWDPAKAQLQYEKQLANWKDAVAKAKEAGKPAPRRPNKPADPRLDSHHPANLFNGKIAPLIPYAIRGAIWYQGESNANANAGLYGLQLETLVKDWRTRWGQGDFPFAWVQLPNFGRAQKAPVEEKSNWALVREGMLKTLRLPHTGMAITIDVGEANDIHPKNKQAVGRRLAMWALAKVYDQKGAASGPLPTGSHVEGNKIVISFGDTDGGLVAKGAPLKGFAIAGPDKKWVKAEAKIEGDKVVVWSPEVSNPTAARYAWGDNPDANMYNGADLPASPFRTDDWSTIGGRVGRK